MIKNEPDIISVDCSFDHEAQWIDIPGKKRKAKEQLSVYRIRNSEHVSNLSLYSGYLSEDEVARAGRYHHKEDEQRFIISRGILRWLLASQLDVPPPAITFDKHPNKKPYISGPADADLQYNVAHSGEFILLAIADSPVGTDIEFVDQQFDFSEVSRFAFSADELAWIRSAEVPLVAFYTLWSRKESLLKATGKGITDDLSSTECLDGVNQFDGSIVGSKSNWFVRSFMADHQHIGNVCYSFQQPVSFYTVKTGDIQ